jgi:hypothetical protein
LELVSGEDGLQQMRLDAAIVNAACEGSKK